MGVLFEIAGETVWEPGQKVARLFLAQVRALEEATGSPSGLSASFDDEIAIDVEKFEEFIAATTSLIARSNSRALMALVRGPLRIMLALHERHTDAPFPFTPDLQSAADRLDAGDQDSPL
ncbi:MULTISPECIES: DUF6086 family protein [Pseudofrankia]|uniref:DUF6086 family protein n=1 Tax=Pseudofrankia TaxID=2994363 RepID=UPI001042823F|nr:MULTISPECIES: DUF6086 family protein [Pseudofrankia]